MGGRLVKEEESEGEKVVSRHRRFAGATAPWTRGTHDVSTPSSSRVVSRLRRSCLGNRAELHFLVYSLVTTFYSLDASFLGRSGPKFLKGEQVSSRPQERRIVVNMPLVSPDLLLDCSPALFAVGEWRRGELNPRPEAFRRRPLHA